MLQLLSFLWKKVEMLYADIQGPSQTGLCLFVCLFVLSIICLLPARTLHFSQIGLHVAPWMAHDNSCLCVFLYVVCPVGNPAPSVHMVTDSVLKGPLCVPRAPCMLFSHQSVPSHFVLKPHSPGMCCVISLSLHFTLATPLPMEIMPVF